jgi:hypothetical protein
VSTQGSSSGSSISGRPVRSYPPIRRTLPTRRYPVGSGMVVGAYRGLERGGWRKGQGQQGQTRTSRTDAPSSGLEESGCPGGGKETTSPQREASDTPC